MKKLLLLASALLVCLYANAQALFLLSPDFSSGKALWMVKAGVNFNNASGSWKDTQINSWEKLHKNLPLSNKFPMQTGFNLSVIFNKSFGYHPLYWGMEFGLGTRGYKANAEWSKHTTSSGWGDAISHVVKQNITLSAFNIEYHPFIIGYKYKFLKNMAADLHVSAFASYDFAGTSKVYNYDYQLSSNTPREKESTTSIKIKDIDSYNSFDAGFNLGLGYWYGHFNIDLSWQRGFIKIYDINDSCYAQSLKLKLGYAF